MTIGELLLRLNAVVGRSQRCSVVFLNGGSRRDQNGTRGYRQGSDGVGNGVVVGHVVALGIGDAEEVGILRRAHVGDGAGGVELGILTLGHGADGDGHGLVDQGSTVVHLGGILGADRDHAGGDRQRTAGKLDGVVCGHVVTRGIGDADDVGVLRRSHVGNRTCGADVGVLPVCHSAFHQGHGLVDQRRAVVDLGSGAAEQSQASGQDCQTAEVGGDGVVFGHVTTVSCVNGDGKLIFGGSCSRLCAGHGDDSCFALGNGAHEDGRFVVGQGGAVVDLACRRAGHGDRSLGDGQRTVDQGGQIVVGYVVAVLVGDTDGKLILGIAGGGLGACKGRLQGVALGYGSVLYLDLPVFQGQPVVGLSRRGADDRKASCGYGQLTGDRFDLVALGHVLSGGVHHAERSGVLGCTAIRDGSRELCMQSLSGDKLTRDRLPGGAHQRRGVIGLHGRGGLQGEMYLMYLQRSVQVGNTVMLGHVVAVCVVDGGYEAVLCLTCMEQGGVVADHQLLSLGYGALGYGDIPRRDERAVVDLIGRSGDQGQMPLQNRQIGGSVGYGIIGAGVLTGGIQNDRRNRAFGLAYTRDASRQSNAGDVTLGQGTVGDLPLFSFQGRAVIYLLGIDCAEGDGAGGDRQLTDLVLDAVMLGHVDTLGIGHGDGDMVVADTGLGLGTAHLYGGGMPFFQGAADQLPLGGDQRGSVVDLVCGGRAVHELGGSRIQRPRSGHDQHDDQQRHDAHDG